MRDAFSLSQVFAALDAWAEHEKSYLQTLSAARQPSPSPEALGAYRNVWLEGFLNGLAASEPVPEVLPATPFEQSPVVPSATV